MANDGPWTMDHEPRTMDHGPCTTDRAIARSRDRAIAGSRDCAIARLRDRAFTRTMNRGPCTMDHGPRSSLQGQPCSLQIFLLKGRSAAGRSLYNNDHASRPSQAASAQETMDMSAPLAHGPLSLNNEVITWSMVHGPWYMVRGPWIEQS